MFKHLEELSLIVSVCSEYIYKSIYIYIYIEFIFNSFTRNHNQTQGGVREKGSHHFQAEVREYQAQVRDFQTEDRTGTRTKEKKEKGGRRL